MAQLLDITTTPISIEVTITPARLEQHTKLPKAEVTRHKGGMKIEADPIRINIDTFDMRESLGYLSDGTRIREEAQKGIKVLYQGMARVVKEGQELANNAVGMRPSDIAKNRALNEATDVQPVLEFLPKEGPDISWDGGTLNIQYEVVQLDFDWDVATQANFEFIPGDIQFIIKQMPRVDIEYIGGPIYVPPSADPNYDESQHFDVKI